ncbi:MAG: VTT domain-containing protein [Oscillospiraceae bacterium]|nr:VTT domain-containing protein [Oscillospiraceae bacterium]
MGWLYVKEFGSFSGSLSEKAERFREVVLSYGNKGVAALIVLHIVQDVVSVIPAAVAQFAGGMIYGLWMGVFTATVGIAISTAINFYATRLLGRRMVSLFVSEKMINRAEAIMAGGVSSLVIFILFVIPFPKTMIVYFVALTQYKAWKLFLLSAVGRLPGMILSTYAGTAIMSGKTPLIIALSFCAVSGLVLVIFRKRIMNAITKPRP